MTDTQDSAAPRTRKPFTDRIGLRRLIDRLKKDKKTTAPGAPQTGTEGDAS